MSSFASRTFGTVVFQGVGACLPQAGFRFTQNEVKGSAKNGGAQFPRAVDLRRSKIRTLPGNGLLDQSPALE
jgi:hypothetical protein